MKIALGAALIVVGILLLLFGYSEYQSAASSVSQFFTGSPTDKSIWMLIAGAASTVFGLVLLVVLPSSR